MNYEKCLEAEATHVRILDTEDNDLSAYALKVTIGNVYKILRNNEKDFEGEEMIKSDDGRYICSFSVGLDIDWLKLVNTHL